MKNWNYHVYISGSEKTVVSKNLIVGELVQRSTLYNPNTGSVVKMNRKKKRAS
jgi:hypothetical protein